MGAAGGFSVPLPWRASGRGDRFRFARGFRFPLCRVVGKLGNDFPARGMYQVGNQLAGGDARILLRLNQRKSFVRWQRRPKIASQINAQKIDNRFGTGQSFKQVHGIPLSFTQRSRGGAMQEKPSKAV